MTSYFWRGGGQYSKNVSFFIEYCPGGALSYLHGFKWRAIQDLPISSPMKYIPIRIFAFFSFDSCLSKSGVKLTFYTPGRPLRILYKRPRSKIMLFFLSWRGETNRKKHCGAGKICFHQKLADITTTRLLVFWSHPYPVTPSLWYVLPRLLHSPGPTYFRW